jgi:hypothetical protein
MVCPTCNPLAAIIFSGGCDFSPSKTIVVRRHFAFGGGSCAAALVVSRTIAHSKQADDPIAFILFFD